MMFLQCIAVSLSSLAAITFLGNERVKFGVYFMWAHGGTGTVTLISALLAWAIRVNICGNRAYGYFASFLTTAFFLLMSLLSLPVFKYKYESDRVINWKEVKSVVFSSHYIFMFILTFYFGVCLAFQVSWEFWYLDGLGGGPVVIGVASLIRKSLLAAFLFISTYIMRKIGDLYTACFALLLFTVAFFALSFTRVYWCVLVIDFFQSAGYGLSVSALTVHFSKAGSKASSGVMLGKFCEQESFENCKRKRHVEITQSKQSSTKYRLKSWKYYGPKLWNNLSDEIKSSTMQLCGL